YKTITVSDSVYSRDDGNVTGQLGIGAGNGGYMGQQFEVTSGTDPLTSVSFYVTGGYTGRRAAAVIWDMASGMPNQIVAYTDTILYADDSARFYTIAMDGGPALLTPGMYAVTCIEFDSTLALGLTSGIFLPNTTWINWPTNPFGNWTNNEDHGAAYAKPYLIRANFGDPCENFTALATTADATCGACTDGSASVTLTEGNAPFTYAWSSGGTTATENNLTMGAYVITVTDQFGCTAMDTAYVGNNCTGYSVSATAVNASCGICNDGSATANTINGSAPLIYLWSNGDTAITADSLLPGLYTVTVTDASGCSSMDTVTVSFTTTINTTGAGGSVAVFPNPSDGNVTIFVNLPAATDVKVEVINALGQIIYVNAHLNYSAGQLPVFIEKPGMYTVRITTSENIYIMPLSIKN
ncbi:MAG: T9SS type A sorting domain-containing protein, partial [Bacteroidota bacterium]|nr:T9SS type A sorting domain-containing protein [Bacteroidota bacterium]